MFLEEQKKNHVEVKLDYCFLAVSKCYSVGFGILLLCLFFLNLPLYPLTVVQQNIQHNELAEMSISKMLKNCLSYNFALSFYV